MLKKLNVAWSWQSEKGKENEVPEVGRDQTIAGFVARLVFIVQATETTEGFQAASIVTSQKMRCDQEEEEE